MTRSIALLAGAAALATTSFGPAQAETLNITVAAAPPPAVTFVGAFKDIISKNIDKRLKESGKGFEIKWNHAYAQTLAKFPEVFEAVEEGIANAGLILKNFEPSNLPMESYDVHMPFSDVTPKQITEIDEVLRQKIPELNGAYTKHNQVFIRSGVNYSMHMYTKFPFQKLEDLKGKKLGSSGSFAQWLRGTGAVTVNSSMNQSFTNIKNGVYEGYPTSIILGFVYKTFAAAPNFTEVQFGPSVTSGITFNVDTWKKIPGFAQQIIREESAKWVDALIRIDEKKVTKFAGIMKKQGVKFSKLPEAERKKWAISMPNIAKEWAARLDKKGLPGTKLMNNYMNELRARNIGVARHWDKS